MENSSNDKNNTKEKVTITKKLLISILIVIAISIAIGFGNYLKSKNKSNDSNLLPFAGFIDETSYFIAKAEKDIKFPVDTNNNELYRLINSNGEKIESKIITENDKFYIKANSNYDAGASYTIQMLEGINFTDENFKNARKLTFKIEETEKEEYELYDNVKVNEDFKITENNGVITASIANTDYKLNDIVLTNNNAYKISNINGNEATFVIPELDEIYKTIDLYKEDSINFDNIEIPEELKNEIKVGFENSSFYSALSSITCAEEIKPTYTLFPNGRSFNSRNRVGF